MSVVMNLIEAFAHMVEWRKDLSSTFPRTDWAVIKTFAILMSKNEMFLRWHFPDC